MPSITDKEVRERKASLSAEIRRPSLQRIKFEVHTMDEAVSPSIRFRWAMCHHSYGLVGIVSVRVDYLFL
jgi:hypothetical protein